ncbi:MAG TPA: ABC transporter permease, partial [Acidimicrobiales bacterium]|nr:ABC transporter permease [Acidimicrobiales bacterium]
FGVAWAALQPFLFMAVFVLFIGRIAGVKPSGVPYVLFAFAGLVAWTFFASALASSSNSLVLNERLVSKVYFPRLLMPLAAAASFLVDFAIGSVLLLALMVLHSWHFSATILLVPVFALLDLFTALAIGVWLSAINVRYRDVVFAVPFFVQVWLFVTPVAYALTVVPSRWRVFYGINPMASVVEGYRWAMLGTPFPPTGMVAVSAVTAVVLLIAGLLYFKRAERTFADVI